jgi:hypothetical protein
MPSKPRSTVLVLLAALAFVSGVLLWAFCPWCEPSVEVLAKTAEQQEQQGNWCGATEKWAKVAEKASENDPRRVKALERLDACKKNCNPPKVANEFKVPNDARTDPGRKDKLGDYYPEGKTVRSISHLRINGNGQSTRFILKGTTNFVYQYRILVETKVTKNTGTTLLFEQDFKEVMQIRAESHNDIKLSLPDSPILAVV